MGKITPDNVIVDKYQGNKHVFSIDKEITRARAVELQCMLGYNPCGYGLYGFEVKSGKTTWYCFDNCN